MFDNEDLVIVYKYITVIKKILIPFKIIFDLKIFSLVGILSTYAV